MMGLTSFKLKREGGYVTGGDEIHREKSRLSLCLPHDGDSGMLHDSHIIVAIGIWTP